VRKGVEGDFSADAHGISFTRLCSTTSGLITELGTATERKQEPCSCARNCLAVEGMASVRGVAGGFKRSPCVRVRARVREREGLGARVGIEAA
jgi:hypothetical protein